VEAIGRGVDLTHLSWSDESLLLCISDHAVSNPATSTKQSIQKTHIQVKPKFT
jgi:hypothetical protein